MKGVADDNITRGELRSGKPGWQAHLKVAYACTRQRHGFKTSPNSLTRITVDEVRLVMSQMGLTK